MGAGADFTEALQAAQAQKVTLEQQLIQLNQLIAQLTTAIQEQTVVTAITSMFSIDTEGGFQIKVPPNTAFNVKIGENFALQVNNNAIVFSVNGVEVLRLTAAGFLFFGTEPQITSRLFTAGRGLTAASLNDADQTTRNNVLNDILQELVVMINNVKITGMALEPPGPA